MVDILYFRNQIVFMIVDSLWLLFPQDEHNAQFDKINQLEYRFVKLTMNGDEGEFIQEFEEFISFYLD